jgi:hypothetical protein
MVLRGEPPGGDVGCNLYVCVCVYTRRQASMLRKKGGARSKLGADATRQGVELLS